MKIFILVVIAAAAKYFLDRDSASIGNLEEGGVYSVKSENGYSVVKILKIDRNTVHITLYKNNYETRPEKVNPKSLTFGMTLEEIQKGNFSLSGMGAGHIPIDLNGFAASKPKLLFKQRVTSDELEGYRDYLNHAP